MYMGKRTKGTRARIEDKNKKRVIGFALSNIQTKRRIKAKHDQVMYICRKIQAEEKDL